MAVVFYAGHGMEVGGENLLIPVSAELRTDADIESEAVSLRSISLQVSKARQLGLVMLDACRNNPFAAKMKRSIGTRSIERGLAPTEPTDNVLIAYAARDGTTASDGEGRNSPFTVALLHHIETPARRSMSRSYSSTRAPPAEHSRHRFCVFSVADLSAPDFCRTLLSSG